MSAQQLAGIIKNKTKDHGFADWAEVEDEYGDGFGATFSSMIRDGLVSPEAPAGMIKLSASGRRLAEG